MLLLLLFFALICVLLNLLKAAVKGKLEPNALHS